MAKIVTKPVFRIYKDLMRQVIKDLGQSVSLYHDPDVADCPNCIWDRVSKKSKNIFDSSFVTPVTIFETLISPQSFTRGRCPVCKGEGKLYNYTPIIVQALVKWDPGKSDSERTVAGVEGFNVVRIKARKTYYEKIRDCNYAIIDGVRSELVKPPILRGLGKQDEVVVAYFEAVEVGKSVKE